MPIVNLKKVRLVNVYVWEPSEPMESGGQAKYRCKMIIENNVEETDEIIRDAIMEACIKKWGKNAGEKMFDKIIDNADKCCYREGDENIDDEGEIREGFEGLMYVAANNIKQPLLIDRQRDDTFEEDGLIVSGNYANVRLDIYAFEHKKSKNKGVSASLLGIQFVKEGDPLGGGPRRASRDDFEEEEEEERPRRGKKRRGRDDDEDDDDEPRGRKRRKDDDEDDEPRGRKRRSRDDDDDEEEEDEDDEPRSRRRKRR